MPEWEKLKKEKINGAMGSRYYGGVISPFSAGPGAQQPGDGAAVTTAGDTAQPRQPGLAILRYPVPEHVQTKLGSEAFLIWAGKKTTGSWLVVRVRRRAAI
jgi:hypothetical protein